MVVFNFERLKTYQKSIKIAVALIKKAKNFPIKFSRIRDQLIGAVISAPLNIAEGTGRITNKDKINFYKNSRASLFETMAVLEICQKLNLISKREFQYYRNRLIELVKMISGLIKSKN